MRKATIPAYECALDDNPEQWRDLASFAQFGLD
jgi:hypothetical protein